MDEYDQLSELDALESDPHALSGRQPLLFHMPATDRLAPQQQAMTMHDVVDEQHSIAILEHHDNLQFLRELPSEAFKLIVTSPPYNIGKSYEARSPMDQYLADQKGVIRECVRVLHPQGSICWQVGNYTEKGEILPLDCLLFPIFREFGLKLRNRIIWHFGHGLHSSKRLSGRYETINWWTKGDDYTWHLDPIRVPSKYPGKRHFKGPRKGELSGNPKGKNPSDVWEFPNVKSQSPREDYSPLSISRRTGRAPRAFNDRRERRCPGSLRGCWFHRSLPH